MRLSILWVLSVAVSGLLSTPAASGDDHPLPHDLNVMQKLGPKAQGHPQAIAVWREIAAMPADELPAILASMNDDNPLANNWLRAAVDSIAERTLKSGHELPLDQLKQHLQDTTQSPRSRMLAFEWIVKADPEARTQLVASMISDPSLELRREAVGDQLAKAESAAKDGKQEAAVALYRAALDSARDLDQIDTAAEQLRELGQDVRLPEHFGFLMKWHLIAPFDNTDKSGFDVAYPPEESIDLTASYDGKEGQVRWSEHETSDEYGMVDLNKTLGKHKGAVAYAVAEFQSDETRPIEIRLGSINANKIWLNGNLLATNHVYHAGRGIDQYIGEGELRKGKNVVLLKIAQNEQTESWAQDWEFQLRVCDQLGSAVLSADRAP